jgi:adenylyltransferase/sulfurtransferase
MIDRNLRDRYSRQTIFPRIGEAGQARLLKSNAVIIGCGALGCNIANLLVRAGVGKVRIIDRDFIEFHNLQRQVLFDEADIKAGLPKAVAAERHLRKVNSTIEIKGIVADVNFSNIEELCRDADVILDGLDNFETRFLINDFALKYKIPWVYGGAIASNGMTMNIIPGETPCFRCIYSTVPAPDRTITCETAGIVGMVPAIIGSIQATEAIKILMGAPEINREIILIDVWTDTFDRVKIKPREGCPTCNCNYEFLETGSALKTTSLCGQNRAVQVVNTKAKTVPLSKLAAQLKDVSNVFRNKYMLRFEAKDHQFTVFPDGRTIIKNTIDESEAQKLYDKYVGQFLLSG